MGDNISPYPVPPPSFPPKSNLPMLYYGLVVVGTAAVVLALYNLILIKWCTYRSTAARAAMMPSLVEVRGDRREILTTRLRLPSFNYKTQAGREEIECAVCLSVVEEGEEVRELPRCNHAFHRACIDMWLYSHRDCPLCRTPVALLASATPRGTTDNSREVLLNFAPSH